MGLKLFMEGRRMKNVNGRVIRVEVSSDQLIDSRFGRHFCPKICVGSGRVCTEKECRSVSCGTWFRLLDFLVVILEFFFVIGEVIFYFSDLKEMVSKSTLRF